MSSLKGVTSKSVNLVSRRFVSSGVVRVVKPKNVFSEDAGSKVRSRVPILPLMHRTVPEYEKLEKVPVDVRIADIFRQYSRNPRDKEVVLSVLQNLASLGSPAIVQFPGFVQLVSELSGLLNESVFNHEEVFSLVSNLRSIGVCRGPHISSENHQIDFDKLGEGLSNQIVSFLDSSCPPGRLFELVSEIQVVMKVNLDRYFYWAFTKAMLPWAKGETAKSDEEYIQVVLGNLQLLTLFKRAHALLDSVEVQAKIVDLIHRNKLSVGLLLELLHNLQPVKSSLRPVIQAAVDCITVNHSSRLEAHLDDLATVLSLGNGSGEIEKILLLHFQKSPEKVALLLECVADLNTSSLALLEQAAKLVVDNVIAVHNLPPNKAANLYYLFAKSQQLAAANLLESVVVGRLPALDPPELSKLVLAFASGTNEHVLSFKALQGTVRRQIARFEPNEFTDAIYGLAYAGLLTKTLLVIGNAASKVSEVRRSDLPRFLWSLAVANFTVPSCWEIGLNRLNSEILTEPAVLETLTVEDEKMIYETLVACSVLKLGIMSPMAVRRKTQFEKTWSRSTSKVDYHEILEKLALPFETEESLRTEGVDKMLRIPILLPRHKLILDTCGENITHPTSGSPMGSAALRHSLWASKNFNVVAITDDQSEAVPKIIQEFVDEISSHQWLSRTSKQPREDTREDVQWESREANSSSHNRQQTWASRN